MALTKRGTKGTALTHDELDANFTHLGGDGSYVFPDTDYSTAGAVLTTDGNGQISWSSSPQQVLQTIYPVGSVYINASNPTNAGTLFIPYSELDKEGNELIISHKSPLF